MKKQIRNIANAYVLVVVLMVILLLFIAIRMVDVYYSDKAGQILEARALELENLYENYSGAGEVLQKLSDDYVNKDIVTRMDGIVDILHTSNPGYLEALSVEDEVMKNLEGQKVFMVPTERFAKFMESYYGKNLELLTDSVQYFDHFEKQDHWRVATKYCEDHDIVIVASENISQSDVMHQQFEDSIEARIEEHIRRQPMGVSLMVIGSDRSIIYSSEGLNRFESVEVLDMRTGKNVFELASEKDSGHFEYQIKTPSGYKEYYAFARTSPSYGAYLILSLQKKNLSAHFGKGTGIFLKTVSILLALICIWTIFRFRSVFKDVPDSKDKNQSERGSYF
ncbi:hypothetical protein [Fusibacter sp. JL216-2]|uniref:hypothetical protein n=1 Tax=Fusibacter sp. JL216-2 TaxID=3071453 RepID=UPI003D34EEF6